MQQPETPLELAITSYTSQLHIPFEDQSSICQIAEDFDVSRTTLSNRLRGVTQSRSRAFTHRQALSHDEEASLVEYIRHSSLLGHPPPPYMVYEVADEIRQNRLLMASSLSLPPPPLGHTWLHKFRKRHPQVSGVWSRQLDTYRLDAATAENLAPWFAEMGTIHDRHHYKPENIFNMDETGHGIGREGEGEGEGEEGY